MNPQEPKAKRSRSQGQRGRRRSKTPIAWWLGGSIVLIALVTGIWLASRDQQESTGARLPGPIGGRDVSQDVNTLIGMPAPSFTLVTASGERHTVPGGKGRPTLIIFHMGLG